MYKILFDDDFYTQIHENKEYFDKLFNILNIFFDVEFILYRPFGVTTPKTPLKATTHAFIDQKILSTHKVTKIDYNTVVETEDEDFDNKLRFSKIFIGKILNAKKLYPDINLIVPLVPNKHEEDIKSSKDYIFYINQYDEELNSNICLWITNENFIRISKPSKDVLFPGKELCKGYENIRKTALSMSWTDKISKLLEIAQEVTIRNNYIHDSKLSSINTKEAGEMREMYVSNGKEKIYLSLDTENGGFEIFDKKLNYLNQYKFSGEFDKSSDPSTHWMVLKLGDHYKNKKRK